MEAASIFNGRSEINGRVDSMRQPQRRSSSASVAFESCCSTRPFAFCANVAVRKSTTQVLTPLSITPRLLKSAHTPKAQLRTDPTHRHSSRSELAFPRCRHGLLRLTCAGPERRRRTRREETQHASQYFVSEQAARVYFERKRNTTSCLEIRHVKVNSVVLSRSIFTRTASRVEHASPSLPPSSGLTSLETLLLLVARSALTHALDAAGCNGRRVFAAQPALAQHRPRIVSGREGTTKVLGSGTRGAPEIVLDLFVGAEWRFESE